MKKILFYLLLIIFIFTPMAFSEDNVKCVDEEKIEGYLERMEVLELQAQARDRRDVIINYIKLAGLTGSFSTFSTFVRENSNNMGNNEEIGLNLWINKKTGKTYELMQEVINSTNAQDGQRMVLYRPHQPNADVPWFAREYNEFFEKFERKQDD